VPSDVRWWLCPTETDPYSLGAAPWGGGVAPVSKSAAGRAQPFRTSGGGAATGAFSLRIEEQTAELKVTIHENARSLRYLAQRSKSKDQSPKKQSPSEDRMGFGNYAIVSSLENKPEAEAHGARQLSSQRLIEARIPGDTSIGETGIDLIGQAAIEYGSERV
jgi:hypothetical protein